jgi:hypothetical protein
MLHGNVPDNFKKLIDKKATIHKNEILLQIANIMGPSDDGNKKIPAGWTYFGQYVDHDLTFDKEDGVNTRTPIFDLDSLYGKGPNSSEHGNQFEGNSGKELFKIGNSENADADLIRNSSFVAQVPDPRNDENIIIASIQLLFQKFHNKLINEKGLNFNDAKKTVLWHYQSIVKNEFLPKIIGKERVKSIEVKGRKVFTANKIEDVFMPLEYSGACYRFGHSMVRERYSFNDFFNDTNSNDNLFFGFPQGRRPNGGHQITEIWSLQGNGNSLLRFFDPSILNPILDADNFSGKIDSKLPSVLFNLEVSPGQNNVLAHRHLLSGQRLELPNGQQAVKALQDLGLNITKLTETEILGNNAPNEIAENTPLWYYILKEAEVQTKGETLGDVGGTIVGETIIGLLESDKTSLLNKTSEWPFKLGNVNNDIVSIIDILEFIEDEPFA